MMQDFDNVDTETLVAIRGALNSNTSSPLERFAHALAIYFTAVLSEELGVRAEKEPKPLAPGVKADPQTGAMSDVKRGDANDLTNPNGTVRLGPNDPARPSTTTNPTDVATNKPNVA